MKKQNDEITIKSLLNIFIPKIWLIVIIATVLGAAFGGYSMLFKKDTYTSQGKYMFSKISYNDNTAQTGLTSSEVDAMQLMIANAHEIIDTDKFARKVHEELKNKGALNGEISLKEIRNMMSVKLCGDNTTCYFLSVTSHDAELSMAVAEIAGRLLVDAYGTTKYAVEIIQIDDPSLPVKANSKNVLRNAVIGFAVGLILTALGVFIASRFDVIIHSRERLEEAYDLPILGVIPRLESDD